MKDFQVSLEYFDKNVRLNMHFVYLNNNDNMDPSTSLGPMNCIVNSYHENLFKFYVCCTI